MIIVPLLAQFLLDAGGVQRGADGLADADLEDQAFNLFKTGGLGLVLERIKLLSQGLDLGVKLADLVCEGVAGHRRSSCVGVVTATAYEQSCIPIW